MWKCENWQCNEKVLCIERVSFSVLLLKFLLNSEQEPEVSDTTKPDSSNAVKYIKIFL